MDLTATLRLAIESGAWAAVRDRLAPDVVLRTSNEAGRARINGPDAIVAHLARPVCQAGARTARRSSGSRSVPSRSVSGLAADAQDGDHHWDSDHDQDRADDVE
jgi:hypothetical protein